MTELSLRSRLAQGQPLIGTFLNLGSPLAAEVCAVGGFDWLVADLEHGAGGEEALLGLLLAAETRRVPVIVRVESDERIRTGRVLDLGASGVMFPRLQTAAEAAAAVAHLRYPPIGDRGVATYNRACAYGLRTDLLETANDMITGVVQIESPKALDQADGIARIAGVDVLFVGPRDLTHALGIPGDFDHPAFDDALRHVVDIARANGVAAGIMAGDPATAAAYLERGFTFVAVSSDSTFLAVAASSAVRELRQHAASPSPVGSP